MDMLPVERPTALATAERLAMGTDALAIVASSAQTGGALLAAVVRMPPGGGPPVMHRHEPAEVYHVLEGEFAFYVGRSDGAVARSVVRAGEVMALAGGTPHTIRNESGGAAEAFVVHTPGREMEAFSRAAAALAARGEPSMDAVLAIAQDHGVELLGPVPADAAGFRRSRR
jgi:mannose-6-phosphate isomerase-like protein (cupin superfamily)